jgi:hypothetical protein
VWAVTGSAFRSSKRGRPPASELRAFATPWRKTKELPVCSRRVSRSIDIPVARVLSISISHHILRGTARHTCGFWLITQRSLVQIQPPLPTISRGYGSCRSPFFIGGCVGVAAGCVIQPVHRRPICPWNQVTIDVDGDLDRGMPHLLFDVHQAFAILKQQRGEGMAQIMEPDPPESGLRQHLVEDPVPEIIPSSGRPSSLQKTHWGTSPQAHRRVSSFRVMSRAFNTSVNCADMSTRRLFPFLGVVVRPATRLRLTSINRPWTSISPHCRASNSPNRSPARDHWRVQVRSRVA